MFVSNAAKLVGAIALLASSPFAALAGLIVADRGLLYAAFVIATIILVGILAALWFQLFSKPLGPSRIGLCAAGVLTAAATCLSYLLLYAILLATTQGASWQSAFVSFALLSFTTFAPYILGAGLLAGWIAGIKWFAP